MNEETISLKNKFFGDKAFYKMILAIAVPIIIQNLLTNLVSMADNIMVGQLGTRSNVRSCHYKSVIFCF